MNIRTVLHWKPTADQSIIHFQEITGNCPHCKREVRISANNGIIDYQSVAEELEKDLRALKKEYSKLWKQGDENRRKLSDLSHELYKLGRSI